MSPDQKPRRKLLKDISMSELLQLRADGWSNREIADKLGVCYATVLHHIGKQPRENRGEGAARPVARPEPQKQERTFTVCDYTLAGKVCDISVSVRQGTVTLRDKERKESVRIALCDLSALADDLLDVGRSIRKYGELFGGIA